MIPVPRPARIVIGDRQDSKNLLFASTAMLNAAQVKRRRGDGREHGRCTACTFAIGQKRSDLFGAAGENSKKQARFHYSIKSWPPTASENCTMQF